MFRSYLLLFISVLAFTVLLISLESCSGNGNSLSRNDAAIAPLLDKPDPINDNQVEPEGTIPAEGDDLILPDGEEMIPFEEYTEPFEGMLAGGFPEVTREDSALERLLAPTGVTAWDGTYNDRARIAWEHPSGEQPTVYYVYRSDTPDNPTPTYIGGRSYPGRIFDDTTAAPGTHYYYKVKSHKTGFTDSYFSNEDEGWRSDRMNAPTNVTASDGTYNDKVYVYWTHPANETPSVYYIYRSETPDDPNPTYIGGRSYPGRTYNDTTATEGTFYYYKVKSHKTGFKDSFFSNEHRGWRTSKMSPPTDVQASDRCYTDKIRVSWEHPTFGNMPDNYYIYRSDTSDDPNPAYLSQCLYPDTYYDDTTALEGELYYYSVKSHKSGYNDSVLSDDALGRLGSWGIQTLDTNGGDTGYFSSIVLDSSKGPHISYVDNANKYLKYVYWEQPTWTIETPDNSGDVLAGQTGIDLDSSEYPHIAYADGVNHNLMYAYFDGTDWTVEVRNGSGNVTSGACIKLDTEDHPSIGWVDATGNLQYTYYTGSEWDLTQVVSSGNVSDYYISLALDSSDYPHFSYIDKTNHTLRYVYLGPGGWTDLLVDDSVTVSSNYCPIALDSNDNPHFVYRDETSGDLLYAWFDGTDWNYEQVDTTGDVFEMGLALDSNDYPHISYNEYNAQVLNYAWWDGTEWIIFTVDDFSSADTGWETSIALDSNDLPHISYKDSGNGNLMYANLGS